ncbi:MAG TPA: hypothetical protein VHF22_11595, partial [Planctomycetota bacterium]|nr:hypothetical protein [Planctomycetota bacterium]
AALAAVAAAARLEVVRSGDIALVRRPTSKVSGIVVDDAGPNRYRIHPPPPRPPDPTDPEGLKDPQPPLYPITVYHDIPSDAPFRGEVSGFERRKGFGLSVETTLKERTVREYLESRDYYRAVLERAKLPLDLRGDVSARNVRIYLEADKNRYFAELLFTSPAEPAPRVAHFVFLLDAGSEGCLGLYVFDSAS